MKIIRGLIIGLTGLALGIGTGILTMIYGWGLQPRSWWWIILFSFIGHFTAQVFVAIAKTDE